MRRHLRGALSARLGCILTPELAAEIEAAMMAWPDAALDVEQFGRMVGDGYVIQAESLRAIRTELERQHAEHWKETEVHRAAIPLALASGLDYRADMERAGLALQLTARMVDGGTLAGSLRFLLGRSNWTDTTYAAEDTLYVAPEHRTHNLGLRLMRFGEKCLRQLGIREIRATTKTVNRAHAVLKRAGFKPVAVEHVKLIGD